MPPPSSDEHLFTDPCSCKECDDVTNALKAVTSTRVRANPYLEEWQDIRDAEKSLEAALKKLHRRHKPEWYDDDLEYERDACRLLGDDGDWCIERVQREEPRPEDWNEELEGGEEGYEDSEIEQEEAQEWCPGLEKDLAELNLSEKGRPVTGKEATGEQGQETADMWDMAVAVPTTLHQRAPGEGVDDAQEYEDAKEPPHEAYEIHGKFIVCDHCRSHGLPCNEAAVCDQCMLHEVACVHHWCRLSRSSKDDCPRSTCRYVHENHMPESRISGLGAEWIVLPGNLLDYLCAERVGKKFGYCHGSEAEIAVVRQRVTMEVMREHVERGEFTWDSVVMRCNCVEDQRLRGEAFVAQYMQALERAELSDVW